MPPDYQLLDFGEGRRLEQWGDVRLDRPDARAVGPRLLPAAEWAAADATYSGRSVRGRWEVPGFVPASWTITHAGLDFEVKCAPSGHTGFFPEQAANWAWMTTQLDSRPAARILNLFAYTGGASMALAKAGHLVTHVDASRPVVGWAQRNAALNRLSSIRWIHEDARRFVARERRRGHVYHALLLDPPAFGQGPGGPWQLTDDLPPLLSNAVALLGAEPVFVLMNLYNADAAPDTAATLLAQALRAAAPPSGASALATYAVEARTLDLVAEDGRRLTTGVFASAAKTRESDE